MKLLSKGFSLIEVIFSIMIISILASIAIPKLINISSKTTLIKAKNDMLIIQNALNNYHNKNILKNTSIILESLDKNKYLFSGILDKPFLSKKNISSFWSKEANSIYHFWLTSNTSIKFIYDKNNYTFICDKNDTNCKEILN